MKRLTLLIASLLSLAAGAAAANTIYIEGREALQCPHGMTYDVGPLGNAGLKCRVPGVQPPPPPPPPPPVPPVQPPTGCTPQGAMAIDLPVGEVRTVYAGSGAVLSFRVPANSLASSSIALTQGAGTQSPGVRTEMSVSKCPGAIELRPGCYAPPPLSNNYAKGPSAYTREAPWAGITSAATLGDRGCWTPDSEGPWYVNVRWVFTTACPYAQCGFSMQWNSGDY